MLSKVNAIKDVKHIPQNNPQNTIYEIEQSNPDYYTHGLFKYPCKFIPEIPRWAIKKYAKTNSVIIDPFAGSGTTLLQAEIMGHDSFGTEIDPLSIELIKAKTTHYKLRDLINIKYEVNHINNKISDDIHPKTPKMHNLYHWFTKNNAYILGKLKTLLDNIHNDNSRLFLKIVFASIIRKSSKADDASPKPYVSSKIPKKQVNPILLFNEFFKRYYKMIYSFYLLHPKNHVTIIKGNALSTTYKKKAGLAITSPPYINAFDYARILRLENLWLGNESEDDILKSKSEYVGTEHFNLSKEKQANTDVLDKSKLLNLKFKLIMKSDPKRAYTVKKFFDDMVTNLRNINSSLELGSYYVIVIGNSVIRGHVIESWKILKALSKFCGYHFVDQIAYKIRNPYLRINHKSRVKLDHILVLRKVVNL